MYRTAITEAMSEEMERDERVFVIGEDVDLFGGVYKTTRGLVEKFGRRRVRGTPISEAAIIGTCLTHFKAENREGERFGELLARTGFDFLAPYTPKIA